MAEEPSRLKEELWIILEREVGGAGKEGISAEDLFAKLVEGRESEVGKIRGYLSSLARSLGLVKVAGRWYLRENVPEAPSAKPERRKREAVRAVRTQEYDRVTYLQMVDSAGGRFTLENIQARVVVYLEG